MTKDATATIWRKRRRLYETWNDNASVWRTSDERYVWLFSGHGCSMRGSEMSLLCGFGWPSNTCDSWIRLAGAATKLIRRWSAICGLTRTIVLGVASVRSNAYFSVWLRHHPWLNSRLASTGYTSMKNRVTIFILSFAKSEMRPARSGIQSAERANIGQCCKIRRMVNKIL